MFHQEKFYTLTRSQRVKMFTEAAAGDGAQLPATPRPMTREEVLFVVKMNIEELMELLVTVQPAGVKGEFDELEGKSHPNSGVRDDLLSIVQNARLPAKGKPTSEDELIADQVDAFVDIDYYNCNAACKAGMDVDAVFDVVHEKGNMAKKFPDGTFHRNEEGKIIKPPEWKEPDIVSIVQAWKLYGTW